MNFLGDESGLLRMNTQMIYDYVTHYVPLSPVAKINSAIIGVTGSIVAAFITMGDSIATQQESVLTPNTLVPSAVAIGGMWLTYFVTCKVKDIEGERKLALQREEIVAEKLKALRDDYNKLLEKSNNRDELCNDHEIRLHDLTKDGRTLRQVNLNRNPEAPQNPQTQGY